MLEPKARNELGTDEVQAKKAAAMRWCELATGHNKRNGGKPWEYMLIPHDVIAENLGLVALRNQRAV